MPFTFERLSLPGVVLVTPSVYRDERGFFMEVYRHSDFAREGIMEFFVQDNHSRSAQNILRGLHYQKSPMAQGKLARCLRGRVFDVVVDIRKGSPAYGKWVGTELSEDNKQIIYVPPAFAHGFVVLGEAAEIEYKCTREYSPEA